MPLLQFLKEEIHKSEVRLAEAEYDVEYKSDSGSQYIQKGVAHGDNEQEAIANFKKQKPHTHIVKVKKRGLFHKLTNLGKKDGSSKNSVYRTDHGDGAGYGMDPDTVPVFKSSWKK